MENFIGFIIAGIFLVLWRIDVMRHDRERKELLDRIQAPTLKALDDHKEREIAREIYLKQHIPVARVVEEQEEEESGPLYMEPPDFAGANTSYRELMG